MPYSGAQLATDAAAGPANRLEGTTSAGLRNEALLFSLAGQLEQAAPAAARTRLATDASFGFRCLVPRPRKSPSDCSPKQRATTRTECES